ncbi:C40 family peptidase [Pengzhenrongella phosphoraccumulans]|uniref:C40 family peptidase n=1 Tax=Pengzhenrongella phosphoraccumulans TaxID=3114394 RepID=UPI00388D22A7
MSAATKAATLATVTLIALTGAFAGLAATPVPAGCGPLGGAPVADLTAEQSAAARVIVAVGQQRSVPARGLVIALMTAMQESGLRNLDYGDRDSLGLFQQRPSTGWGTPTQVRDPAYAAAAFYGGPSSPTPNSGLLDVAGWQQLPLTVAAQAVQRSAFPNAYARWQSAATTWLAAIAPGDAPAAGGCAPASGSAAVALEAGARWVGTPYAWGGGDLNGPSRGTGSGAGTVGFDCSGLTRYAWAHAGITLPRTSREQWFAPGMRIASMSQLQPGDLVFFATDITDPATIFHVGLAAGGDSMLEAPQTGDVVKIVTGVSSNSYWSPRFIGALRLTG